MYNIKRNICLQVDINIMFVTYLVDIDQFSAKLNMNNVVIMIHVNLRIQNKDCCLLHSFEHNLDLNVTLYVYEAW